MPHEIPKENLSAYLDGELSPPEKEALARHIETCADCILELEMLRTFLGLFRAKADITAPAGLADAVFRASRFRRSRRKRPIWLIASALLLILLLIGLLIRYKALNLYR